MITILPYHTDHLRNLKRKEVYESERVEKITGTAMTIFIDQTPVAILAYSYPLPGIIQVGAVLSDSISRAPISFHKTVLNLVQFYFTNEKLRRMQFTVRVGYTQGWKWAQSLGFQCEGIMKKYGLDGHDYWLFSRCA